MNSSFRLLLVLVHLPFVLHGEPATALPGWKLVWQDEFDGQSLDGDKWTRCRRGTPDWQNTMAEDARLLTMKDGILRLWGIQNDRKNDSAPFVTAGVTSRGKFSFRYGCEWTEDKIDFTVNGRKTHTYPRVPELGRDQWPFRQPFYFIFSMQVGGGWVNQSGPTKTEDYPAWLEVDWVRVYERPGRPPE